MRDRTSYLLTDLTGGGHSLYDKKLEPSTFTDLARRVERLAPHHRQPECYHEDKSEIVAELRRLADEVRRYG